MSMHQRLKDKMKEQLQSLYTPNEASRPRELAPKSTTYQQPTKPAEVETQDTKHDRPSDAATRDKLAHTFGETNHREAWDNFSFASRDSQLRENPELLDSVLHYQSGGLNHLMNTSDHESQTGHFTPRGLQTSTKKEREIEIYNLDYQSADGGDKNADHMLLIGHESEEDRKLDVQLSSSQALPMRSTMFSEIRETSLPISKSAMNSYSAGKHSQKSGSKSGGFNHSPSKDSRHSLHEPFDEDYLIGTSKLESLTKSPGNLGPKIRPEWNSRFSSTAEKDKNSSKSGSAIRRAGQSANPRQGINRSAEKENIQSPSLNHQQSTENPTKATKSLKPSAGQLKQLEKLHDQSAETFRRLGAVYQQLIDEYEPWTPVSPDVNTLGEMRDCARKYTQTLSKLTNLARRLKQKQAEIEAFAPVALIGKLHTKLSESNTASPSKKDSVAKPVDAKEWKNTASRRDAAWASSQLVAGLLARLPGHPS